MIRGLRRWVQLRRIRRQVKNARRAIQTAEFSLGRLQKWLHESSPIGSYSADELAGVRGQVERMRVDRADLMNAAQGCERAWQRWWCRRDEPDLAAMIDARLKNNPPPIKWGPDNPQPPSPFSHNPNDQPIASFESDETVEGIIEEAARDEVPPPPELPPNEMVDGTPVEDATPPRPTGRREAGAKRPDRRVAPRRRPRTRRPASSED